jgi:tetratricopeptide (TPR) repeat protein
VLFLLSFLGPDNITKPILRSLLQAKNKKSQSKLSDNAPQRKRTRAYYLVAFSGFAVMGLAIWPRAARRSVGVGLITLAFAEGMFQINGRDESASPLFEDSRSVEIAAGDVFEHADQVWKILKSYSLVDIKEGKGSMHRLLSQALQVYQSPEQLKENFEICVRAMEQLWSFKPDMVDSWQSASCILDHVKAVVSHAVEFPGLLTLESASLSREAGIFSAMALNRFEEAQCSLEQALAILNSQPTRLNERRVQTCQAACLHELGKVYRYQGSEAKAGEALNQALSLRCRLSGAAFESRRDVAATLHELGILEVKNHNLTAADDYLNQSLHLRQKLQHEATNQGVESECAATLHQLATVHVALKPPNLTEAERLLREALALNMNIGQRAATLKQLARVSQRRVSFKCF